MASMNSPLDTQIGGSHYKGFKIQPVEYCIANNIPFVEGNVIKYVSRWKQKGGVQDLKKALHLLEILIHKEEERLKEENNEWRNYDLQKDPLRQLDKALTVGPAYALDSRGLPIPRGQASGTSPSKEPTPGS